jgi:hypothetical protein
MAMRRPPARSTTGDHRPSSPGSRVPGEPAPMVGGAACALAARLRRVGNVSSPSQVSAWGDVGLRAQSIRRGLEMGAIIPEMEPMSTMQTVYNANVWPSRSLQALPDHPQGEERRSGWPPTRNSSAGCLDGASGVPLARSTRIAILVRGWENQQAPASARTDG